MKRGKLEKFDGFVSLSRKRSVQILIGVGLLYMLLVTVEVPFVFRTGFSSISQEALIRPRRLDSEAELEEREAPTRPLERVSVKAYQPTQGGVSDSKILSGLVFDAKTFDLRRKNGYSQLYESAKYAWEVGTKLWKDIQSGKVQIATKKPDNHSVTCPHSISLSGSEFSVRKGVMEIPCGLTLGSHITVVGRPMAEHSETKPNDESLVASQFILELQGLKTVEGEAPPRVLHFNPRAKGDWSGKPVIELNTCYRMQWGQALRCEGWKSKADEETVDGQVKCEKWIRDDESRTEETKAIWWLKRLIGRTEKVTFEWPFPFTEGKLFVLTLSAGLEGYHVNVDGRHIASFPYRMGYTLEDATGLFIGGDINVKSLFAASLPSSHPSFSPQRYLEWLDKWRAPPLPDVNVELFIGILSAGNHFAERMAVRKSWMQHELIKSSTVVARFFVALHSKEEVNMELKKEAEFFGDIIIVPYMDNYDLVVLKTVAICEYGVRTIAAKSIMKCDDDTFVRADAVLSQAQKVPRDKSFYVGNINYFHKPLRYGKWAVTYEEWPEENYPPYANGPGYILSFDIARFIVSEFERHKLRLFKMEDVSMGMWVEQFNSSKSVEYSHSLKYCQYGCVENYVTAHYQSPRQMLCLWDKLQKEGKPQCCNMR